METNGKGAGGIGEKLDLIAVWLELHGRAGQSSELCLRASDEVHAELGGNKASVARTVRNWFAGRTEPSRRNLTALGAAIERIAARSQRRFETRWLQFPLPELAARIGQGLGGAGSDGGRGERGDERPVFEFAFQNLPQRIARIAEKYVGAHFIYRCNSGAANAVVRNVIWIGPFSGQLFQCSMATGVGTGKGFVIPAADYLSIQLVFGVSGDYLWSETAMIRRQNRSEKVFSAIWMRPSASSNMATAYRAIVLRKPELDDAAGRVDALSHYCHEFRAGTNVYDRLMPVLAKNSEHPPTATGAYLTMDRFAAAGKLHDFFDDEV